MLTEERYQIILKLLSDKKSITTTEIQQILNISESTARRDILTLHNLGKLRKVFGGAVEITSDFLTHEEPTVEQREVLYVSEKKSIAKYAAKLINKGDYIYLDAGTTTSYIIDYLVQKDITVVTNAVAHAQRLAKLDVPVILLGGELKKTTEAVIGSLAMQMLHSFHFNKAFLGTNGVTDTCHFTTPEINEAMVKKTAAQQSLNRFVLCDHSKFDKITPFTFMDFKQATILTDSVPEGYKNYDNIIIVQ